MGERKYRGYPKTKITLCGKFSKKKRCTCEPGTLEAKHAHHVKHWNKWNLVPSSVTNFVQSANDSLANFSSLFEPQIILQKFGNKFDRAKVEQTCTHFNSLFPPLQKGFVACERVNEMKNDLCKPNFPFENQFRHCSLLKLATLKIQNDIILHILHFLISYLELISSSFTQDWIEISVKPYRWWVYFCAETLPSTLDPPRLLRRPIVAAVHALAANMHLRDYIKQGNFLITQIKINVFPTISTLPKLIKISGKNRLGKSYIEYTPKQ